jgi:hypothetical protein
VERTPFYKFSTGAWLTFTTESVCVCLCSKGEIRGCFLSATGGGEPVEEDRSGWKIVQEELQPYAAADLGFLHEGQRPYASTDHISPPCWAGVIPQDPTREQDLTPDSPWPRNPKSRDKSYLARSFSVFLVLSAILAFFFYIVLCYQT